MADEFSSCIGLILFMIVGIILIISSILAIKTDKKISAEKTEKFQLEIAGKEAEINSYKKLIIEQNRVIELQENLIKHYESKLKSLMNETGENKS